MAKVLPLTIDDFDIRNALVDEEVKKPQKKQQFKEVAESHDSYETDETLHVDDMLVLLKAELDRKGVAGHHLISMNEFYMKGINQIATQLYNIEVNLKNKRDKTDEDKQITDIKVHVAFESITLSKPSTTLYKSGSYQILTPNMARTRGITYSCDMHMNATITATATYLDKSTNTRQARISDFKIGSVPCIVGSEMCVTYGLSKETLKEMKEDHLNPGGMFIINGVDWVIESNENITNNMFHVYKTAMKNYVAWGTIISKPGDAFENSRHMTIALQDDGAIILELSINKGNKWKMPFYVLFRALGMARDYDIFDHIVYGVNHTDTITQQLNTIIEEAFKQTDKDYETIMKETNRDKIINHVAMLKMVIDDTTEAKKNKNVTKFLNNRISDMFDQYVFPHIGVAERDRIFKARMLGRLINKLLLVHLNIVAPTDRDHYGKKRIHSAGMALSKAFKTHFNFAINTPIQKELTNALQNSPFSAVPLADSVKAAVSSDQLEQLLAKAITAGNKKITIKRNEIMNRISSQTLYHKNDLNVKAILNTITTPTTASNQNDRADEMRRVHPSYLGYIDPTQSAESGVKVGMGKQIACGASITPASSSFVLREQLLADTDYIIPLDTITPSQISTEKLVMVDVNGMWLGCCRSAHELINRYTNMRRHKRIHHLTTIEWDPSHREVMFKTDVGRMHRPLCIVYSNIVEYNKARRAGDKKFVFRQYIKLTLKHIHGLMSKKLTMDDLLDQQIIEYISPEESNRMLLARNMTVLRDHKNDVTRQYTHCDYDQSMFGIVSLASPDANHSNGTRITYYTCHRKQAASWFALNYPHRIDKNVTLQHYCEKPLISTFTDTLSYPSGQNVIVAMMMHGGQNMEDSIVANQSSVDCGMYNASFYTYEKGQLDKGEEFGNLDHMRTRDMKRGAIYEYTNNGFIAEGTLVKKGYVLIVKTYKLPKPEDQFTHIDKSIIYKKDEPCRVDDVIESRNDKDELNVKVKLIDNRSLGIGDKLASRTGNKGIVAETRIRIDMPYCLSGVTPDLLINPHSIPSRMAVNQLRECTMAILAALEGCHIDATTFKNTDIDGILERLKAYGVMFGGHERMYNGKTNEPFDVLIFIGPTNYQRLQKFVIDEQYANMKGPSMPGTRQPLEGKSVDGGARIGEMEGGVYLAHGSMKALHQKFYEDSDGADIYVCRECGNRAIVNERHGIYKCKTCGDSADITRVGSAWVANLFFNELSAMNIKLKFELDPITFATTDEKK